jgi:hypothetical protein
MNLKRKLKKNIFFVRLEGKNRFLLNSILREHDYKKVVVDCFIWIENHFLYMLALSMGS